MLNTPILDVAIGLIFVFLVYSLLATSVKEAIATALGLRARMLKKGIEEGMLSDTPTYGRWKSIYVGIRDFIDEAGHMILGVRVIEHFRFRKGKPVKIGDKFYNHPVIKNYGSSRIFPYPSYIAPDNFSVVLIDVLKDEYWSRVDSADNKFVIWVGGLTANLAEVKKQMVSADDAGKIKTLLDYYQAHYADTSKNLINEPIIDKEPGKILAMLLEHSNYVLADFNQKLQDWFNDSMNRVTGWYKRQVQIILFMIGMVVAITLNVDTISIAQKLSKDKTIRAQTVQLAIESADKYKNDPRVKGGNDSIDNKRFGSDSADFKASIKGAQNVLDSDSKNITNLLALGWGDFGRSRDSGMVVTEDTGWVNCAFNEIRKESKGKKLSADSLGQALTRVYDKHWIKLKVAYVFDSITGSMLLGFLITAFAISLGAPFWFDMLNKAVSVRASGLKEDGSDTNPNPPAKADAGAPGVTVQVNTNQTGEEAAG